MLKLHVEVTVLDPEKKKKATAAWVVFEGKSVRGAGRISKDPKGLIATSAGRTFAAELHAAHGKIVKPTSVPVGAPAAEKPAKAKGKKTEAAAAEKPAKAPKGKKAKAADAPVEGNGAAEVAAEPTGNGAVEVVEDKPAKAAKAPKAEKPKKAAKKSKKAEVVAEA